MTGDIQATNQTIMSNDKWHVSADGKNRFWFGTNSRTYFGTQDGYSWRNSPDTDIATLNDYGSFYAKNKVG